MQNLKNEKVNLGFIGILMTAIGLATTANTMIKSFERPSISPVSIPGGLGLKDLSPILLEEISMARVELETYHSRELELERQQEELGAKLIKQEELKAKIKKVAPLLVIGVVGISLYLILRRKK